MTSDPTFRPATGPPVVRTAATAIVAVGVAALLLGSGSVPAAIGALGGVALAAALRYLRRDELRPLLVGTGLLSASIAAAGIALALIAVGFGGGRDAALVGLLWVATAGGIGIGRDALWSTPIDRAGRAAFVGSVSLPLAIFGVLTAWLTLRATLPVLLGVRTSGPALDVFLVLVGAVVCAVGIAFRSFSELRDRRRPIDRQFDRTGTTAVGIGATVLVLGGIVAYFNRGRGLYAALEAIPGAVSALTVVTSSPAVRGLVLAIGAAVVLPLAARSLLIWFWPGEAGERAARRVVTAASAAWSVALAAAVVGVAALVLSVPLAGGRLGGAVTDANVGPLIGVVVGTYILWSLLLFVLSALVADDSGRGSRERSLASSIVSGVGPCLAGLLGAAITVAVSDDAVATPLIAIGAAAIVWDLGRLGSTMGVELGDAAASYRGAIVRIAGSVAVGVLGTLGALLVANVVDRIGRVLRGPIVLAAALAIAAVVVVLWRVWREEASPSVDADG